MQTALNPLYVLEAVTQSHSYSALIESLKTGIIRRESGALESY